MADDQIRQALIEELSRQAEDGGSELSVSQSAEGLDVNGMIDLDALAAAVAGALAGGP